MNKAAVALLAITISGIIMLSGCTTTSIGSERWPGPRFGDGNFGPRQGDRNFMNGNLMLGRMKQELGLPGDATNEQVLEAMKQNLGLPNNATEEEVRAAWREKNFRCA